MTTVTLTNLEHVVSKLSDRTVTDNVADELMQSLVMATNLIATHTRKQFTSTAQVKVFDTKAGFADTPGAFSTPFTQPYRPKFDLPVTGPITGMVVKYRTDATPMDEDFSWDDVEALVEQKDYLYDALTGTITLLFAPADKLQALRVSYTEGYTQQPQILYGSRKTELLQQVGVTTVFDNIGRLFAGVKQKPSANATTYAATGGANADTTLVLPTARAMHSATLYAAEDAALTPDNSAVALSLRSSSDELGAQTITTPLPGQVYTIAGDPDVDDTTFVLRMVPTSTLTLTASLIDLNFVDPDYTHLRGSAPSAMSEAAAIFAAHLYKKGVRDGIGRDSDDTGRDFNTSFMPPEVQALLREHKEQIVSFV